MNHLRNICRVAGKYIMCHQAYVLFRLAHSLLFWIYVPKYLQVNIFQKVHFIYTNIKEFEQTNQHDSTAGAMKKNLSILYDKMLKKTDFLKNNQPVPFQAKNKIGHWSSLNRNLSLKRKTDDQQNIQIAFHVAFMEVVSC